MEQIEFGKGGVPVRIVAEIYGKDPSWIRAGLITGYLPIGNATRNGQVITSIDQMNSKFGRITIIFHRKNCTMKQVIFGKEVSNYENNRIKEKQILD